MNQSAAYYNLKANQRIEHPNTEENIAIQVIAANPAAFQAVCANVELQKAPPVSEREDLMAIWRCAMKLCDWIRDGSVGRTKRHVILALALGSMLAFVILLTNREPSYQGRTFTSWLTQCHETPLMEEQRLKEAQDAIRSMGSGDILPRLLKMVEARDGRLRSWIISNSVERSIPVLKDLRPAEKTQLLAIAGFEALGAKAAPAVGRLTLLLNDSDLGFVAVRCLAGIGKPAELALRQSLTNKDSEIRYYAVTVLSTVVDEAEDYIALLKHRLDDSTAKVRFAAVQGIGNQTDVPAAAVPLLVSALLDSSDHVVSSALSSLTLFGTDASSAFPALSNLFENGREPAINEAIRAMVAVDPEKALPPLLQCIRSPDPRRRHVATSLLSSYARLGPEAISALGPAAADSDPQVARMASKVLAIARSRAASLTNTTATNSLIPSPVEK